MRVAAVSIQGVAERCGNDIHIATRRYVQDTCPKCPAHSIGCSRKFRPSECVMIVIEGLVRRCRCRCRCLGGCADGRGAIGSLPCAVCRMSVEYLVSICQCAVCRVWCVVCCRLAVVNMSATAWIITRGSFGQWGPGEQAGGTRGRRANGGPVSRETQSVVQSSTIMSSRNDRTK